MTTPTPLSPKVAMGGVSGAVAVVVLALLGACGVHPSAEVSVAVTTIVAGVVSWATPDHLRSLGARYTQRIEEDRVGRHADDGDPSDGSPDLEHIPAADATSDTKTDAAGLDAP